MGLPSASGSFIICLCRSAEYSTGPLAHLQNSLSGTICLVFFWSLSSHLLNSGSQPGFPLSAPLPGNLCCGDSRGSCSNYWACLLVPHLSGSSVLHCLVPNAWRIIVSRNLSVLWLFRVEGSVLFPALNLGHKWKSLELQLSRKLFSFGLFLRV